MNYSQEELDKFNQMAPKWWDPNGPMKPLHQINPLRLEFIKNNLDTKNLNNIDILDIGCGGGILSESMALDAINNNTSNNTIGIDLSEDAINIAKLHCLETQNKINKEINLDYQLISVEDFLSQNPDKKFDVITCLEMLEHVPDPSSIIKSIKKLLKPGGRVYFSTLNRNLKSYLLAIVGAEYILNWIPHGTHEYSKFIKPSELARMLRDQDLNIRDISGITYSILSRNFNLSKDIDVNYILCAS